MCRSKGRCYRHDTLDAINSTSSGVLFVYGAGRKEDVDTHASIGKLKLRFGEISERSQGPATCRRIPCIERCRGQFRLGDIFVLFCCEHRFRNVSPQLHVSSHKQQNHP